MCPHLAAPERTVGVYPLVVSERQQSARHAPTVAPPPAQHAAPPVILTITLLLRVIIISVQGALDGATCSSRGGGVGVVSGGNWHTEEHLHVQCNIVYNDNAKILVILFM